MVLCECHTLCGCVGMARMPYPPIITRKPSIPLSAAVLRRPLRERLL